MEIVPPAIEAYCESHSAPASPLLVEIHSYTTRNHSDAQMLVGPLEAAFLQLLIRASGARRILEIGTFTGYSALAMAEALPDDGSVITCDIDSEHAEIANGFFQRSRHRHKISLRLGPALKTLGALPADVIFDFVFLDADKENYVNYYDQMLPMLKPGGLIVADNVLWSGNVLNPTAEADLALVRFNRHVRADARVECVVLPLRDGVSLIRKRS
jgi:caffeoyl-CoA O-methyltransferase